MENIGRHIAIVTLIVSPIAHADYLEDIGFNRLATELGANMPTGSGVVVGHAEAAVTFVDHNNDGTADVPVYWPDYNNQNLANDSITDYTGAKAYLESFGIFTSSGHATAVASFFYGDSGIAPGINTVSVFWADHWGGPGVLSPASGNYDWPLMSSSRITNHSYIADVDPVNYPLVADLLRRMDWLIDIDEHIQVTGLKNDASDNAEFFSNAFNVIRVGTTDGTNGSGTSNVDTIYTGGRTGIDIVVDLLNSSNATPVVAAATGLLIEIAHSNLSLSTDPVATFTQNRIGNTIYNAERSEVIKAALLAGADRITHNTGSAPDITDYREFASNQTANGLDKRLGAGQLNIYNSYRIIAAGEQNSAEDGGAGSSGVAARGFDYDPSFGGSNGGNTVASYYFSTGATPMKFTASLVWNLAVDAGPSTANFAGNATFYDIDLYVYDVTSFQVIVAGSESELENTENIWITLPANRNYMIQAEPKQGQSAFEWDYALAWQLTPDPSAAAVQVPIPFSGLLLFGTLLSLIGVRYGSRRVGPWF